MLETIIDEYLANVLAGERGSHVSCEGNTVGVAVAVGVSPGIPGLKSEVCVRVPSEKQSSRKARGLLMPGSRSDQEHVPNLSWLPPD